MIDLHCHLLPNIDDGSRSVEQSVEVLRVFAASGITDVILTPHVAASEMTGGADDAVERREQAFDRLKSEAPESPRLSLGFEIMLDRPLPVLAGGDRRFSLAGSRYYLVEFPNSVVPHFATAVLSQITRAGVIPIVAHPERYAACTPQAVAEWREVGARIQVDATTLARSQTRGRRARELVAYGLADLVAADNHGDSRSVRTAADFLKENGGERMAERLTTTNPGAVLADGEMEPVEAIALKASWSDRIARFFGE